MNDLVEFEYDDKGNARNLVTTGQATTPPPAQQAEQRQAWSKPAGGFKQKQAEKEQYWADKEERDKSKDERQQTVVEPRITWSSAQSDAVRLVTAALQHDLLSFGNANKGAKLGLLLEFVDEVTQRFAVDRWNSADKLKAALAKYSDGAKSDDVGLG